MDSNVFDRSVYRLHHCREVVLFDFQINWDASELVPGRRLEGTFRIAVDDEVWSEPFWMRLGVDSGPVFTSSCEGPSGACEPIPLPARIEDRIRRALYEHFPPLKPLTTRLARRRERERERQLMPASSTSRRSPPRGTSTMWRPRGSGP